MHSMGGLLQDKLKEKLRIFNSKEENLDLFQLVEFNPHYR